MMRLKSFCRTLSMTLLISGVYLPAQGQDAPADKGPDEDTREEISAGETTPPEETEEREPGEAFRNFQPSEEISADNAVTFPVDI